MKKIIEGKRYDTDTATLIASYNNGLGGGDFNHVYEKMYITRKGQWFMEYKGGPLSKYANSCGTTTYGDNDLTLMSSDEAYEWLNQHQKCCKFDLILERYFKDYNIEEG